MGMSKSDLLRQKRNLKLKLEELEKKAISDPLKKNVGLHDEIALLKRKLAEIGD